ncbi:pentapeptide repeats (8 copies) [Desulfosporosinus acididurans]|uniref:Pentapeptide repeats (8 copies) n=1 Tax=Desulfosporosinus acididurans TaxID=476652 RepID=A0A0J1FT69_9FIRM|nr:pentapeptide repeat-containing protein [Desulfosporosinus acididurans]KLU66664.1 pentapeptide repeats (8 copies) [Desulfosporosinus acididurans]
MEKQIGPQNTNKISFNREYPSTFTDIILPKLRADCENCFGLCCVALYFSASEGFPIDKKAGQPCLNLQSDFRCRIHKDLQERGLKGCLAFDCSGAGQKVSQVSYAGKDWRTASESAKQMFEVFLIMRQLHELLWYLTEALTLKAAFPIHGGISTMLEEIETLTQLRPDLVLGLDVAALRADANVLLLKASELLRTDACLEQKVHAGRRKTFSRGADLIGKDLRKFDLRGANLRGAFLIAADLRGADLSGTDFIGADFRDTDIRGADLSKSIFLTQGQINAAKGDNSTLLPYSLLRPASWNHKLGTIG